MNIVAPTEDEEKVRNQMARPTFERILDQLETGSLNYISFEKVRELREVVEENAYLSLLSYLLSWFTLFQVTALPAFTGFRVRRKSRRIASSIPLFTLCYDSLNHVI